MKKLLIIMLSLAILLLMLTGCDRRVAPTNETNGDKVAFEPETTAVSGGLTQAVEQQSLETEPPYPPMLTMSPEPSDAPVSFDEPAESEQPIVADAPIATDAPSVTDAPSEAPVVMPFATATPQPNASIARYADIAMPNLGFKFSYPADWTNIPGRSTVCFKQPLAEGTVYPARVAMTMKRMPHKIDAQELQEELVSYLKLMRTQYDEATFKVDTNLDTETKFMGNNALASSYYAYDGKQEIQGYVITTFFERYIFTFHFLCAYEDYKVFEPSIHFMRDSVQPAQ